MARPKNTMQDAFFRLAAEAGLQRDAAAADPVAATPTQAEQALVQARAAGDRPAFIRMGRLLRAAGRLNLQTSSELAGALLDIGCPDEALDLLQDERFAERTSTPERAVQLARALAGVERIDEAALTLVRAFKADLDGLDAEPVRQLWRVLKRGSSLGETSSWGDFEIVIYGWLSLGLTRPAVSAWRRALTLADGPLSEALDAIVDAAPGVLRVSDPGIVDDILLDLSRVLPGKYDGRALAATAMALRMAARNAEGPPPLTERVAPLTQFIAGEACAAAGRWAMAIERFAGLHGEGPLKHLGAELARCTGRDVLQAYPLTFAPLGTPKVFDLFPFNGEFGMLEFKLAEMGPWVDHFVLVEAARTFTGLPKPLYFTEREDEFRKYGDKIIHVVVDDFPGHVSWSWAREFHQRDCAIKGLAGWMAPDDIVLLSDADEIVDPKVLDRFSGEIRGLAMRTFQFFFNYEVGAERHRVKTVMARARMLASNGSSCLRIAALAFGRIEKIEAAGWHFSSIKEPEEIAIKMRSYSHEEHAHLDGDYFTEQLRAIRAGIDAQGFVRRELDDQFPAYLRRNRETLANFIL